MQAGILLATTDAVPGREITQTLGLVRANAVRARHIGSDVGAVLKSVVGGRIGAYEKLLSETREQLLSQLQADAVGLGADAIVGLRFATSMIMESASEVLVYGTAVRLR